jgi:hypothetical protein
VSAGNRSIPRLVRDPPNTDASPFIRPSKPCRATCAGSSFDACPTLVSRSSARSKNSVSVGPGRSAVTLTPVSVSSSRSARAKDCTNAFDAP